MSVLIETTIGDLVFDLYTDERPRSCLNFLKLCKIKYYNFCLFHSVRRNFITQSGDPSGTGRGGESIYAQINGGKSKYFDLELKPRIKHNTRGTISFVNNGNNMHGSQFFITLGDGLAFLDGKHTVFGQLAEGLETLEKLNETICDDNHKPYQDVRISHTIILEDPFDDPDGLQIPDRSPEPNKEQLESGRIGAEEDIDDKGKTKEAIQKELDDKELEIGTKILETVGDIDDAELKPPENVLFVCKLNPVTNAEDLQIIFSRFGKILSCEIIEDHKTGDSLCYGFVEFKEVEACEKAYFKMDNVLIDDRRIHVDFCQSVAKLKKWHKSSAFKKWLNEKIPTTRSEYKLKNQSKDRNDSYAMVFENDHNSNAKKKRNQDQQKDRRKNEKTVSEKEEAKRKESRKSQISKEKRYRRSSTSSSSSSDDKESNEKIKKGNDGRDSSKRNKKYAESDSSSDEDDRKRKQEKRKPLQRNTAKKPGSNTKKYRNSESDSDYHEKIKAAKSKTKKNKSKYSDSDSPSRSKPKKNTSKYDSDSESDDMTTKKKSPKRKVFKKSDRSSSEDESIRKRKKPRESSRSRPNQEDSDDTEEYVKNETKRNRSKRDRYSSDESMDEKRRPTKVRKRSTSYEDQKYSSAKKSSSSNKKSRRRKDSEYSDSSH